MSYDIIKRIRIQENKVMVKCASNNVYPRYYEEFEATSLTKILQEQGQEALDIVILHEYEKGNFQRGANKYVRALKVLRHLPEYMNFDWRANGEKYDINTKNRETREEELKQLLKRALTTRLPRDKFIVTKDYFGKPVYIRRVSKRSCSWTSDIERAKIFKFENEANRLKECFIGGEVFNVQKIK